MLNPKVTVTMEGQEHLRELQRATHRVIYQVSALFPFDFFPDTIVVSETKVEFIYRYFFATEEVFPVNLHDILTVSISSNPFFSELSMQIVGYETNPRPIRFLPRYQATLAKNIITGLAIADREGIDLSQYSIEDIRRRAAEIGESQAI